MRKKLSVLFITLISAIIIMVPINAHAAGLVTPGVTYRTHVQTYGWQGYVFDGALSGTVGQSKRLEAINIKGINLPAGAHLQYEVQVQTYGWQGLKSDGQEAGTDGQSKRLEAIKIKLVGMPGYSVEYKVQVQTFGWQGWVSDGALSGTVGQSKRLEAIDIKIVKAVKVSYIDVGQGDSILIQTPNGKNMLIDAGTNESSDKVTSYLKSLGITQLDIIAGTHPHEDHIGGIDAVINMFKVGKIYMPNVTITTQTFEDVITAIKNKGITVNTPTPGTTVDLDPDVKLEILAPNSATYDDLNNYSIVFKLTYGNKSFLFEGDAEALSENEMISKGYNLSADVLKVGHHGSNSSTSDAFLVAVSPKYAVISVGKGNTYGHPTQTTLDKLKKASVTVYRTDVNGTVVATCDGQNIIFDTQQGVPSVPVIAPIVGPVVPSGINKNIQITKVDLNNEIVTIKNNGTVNTDMTGWKLVSTVGNQTYNFPSGYILKTGTAITIASGKSTGTLKWTTANIWNNTGDKAELYGSNGTLISYK